MAEMLQDSGQLESTTVKINRTAATVKGGRRMSFSALVVVGDRQGSVGIGYGKAPGVPAAIEKAQKDARKKMCTVKLQQGTLPHPVTGTFGSSKVRLIPAAPGTGVVAGATVRAVLEMVGVNDCLTKAYGSTNEINMVKAVVGGLQNLQTREDMARLRGVEILSTTVDETFDRSAKSMAAQEAKAMAAAASVREKTKAQDAENKAQADAKAEADKAKAEEEAKLKAEAEAEEKAKAEAEAKQAEDAAKAEAAPDIPEAEATKEQAKSEESAGEEADKKPE